MTIGGWDLESTYHVRERLAGILSDQMVLFAAGCVESSWPADRVALWPVICQDLIHIK
jgi:hypothetical protein